MEGSGDHPEDGRVVAAVSTREQREEFMQEKFGIHLAQRGLQLDNFIAQSIVHTTECLILGGINAVSVDWYTWAIDLGAWNLIQEQVTMPEFREEYPWAHQEPRRTPRNWGEVSKWFHVRTCVSSYHDRLCALHRLQANLPLMKCEIQMEREIAGVTSIELRQMIWDDVFPGGECAAGQPFELAVPSATMLSHVVFDIRELIKYLPAAVTIVVVNRLHARGHFVRAIIFSYAPNVFDNSMNRMSLALAYNIGLNWAKNIIISETSTPLSQAFKNFAIQPEDDDEESPQIVGMAEQLNLDARQLARCAEELALKPWVSEADHAVYRVSQWLEQQIDLTSAENRCRLLRLWCRMRHVNLEHLSQEDLQQACCRA